MSLRIRMWLLVALMFGILYAIIVGVGTYSGVGGAGSYLILAFVFTAAQYLVGPYLVAAMMKVKWVSESEDPQLHWMVTELARNAGIPKPKIGISEINIPNAFAFGRTRRDGRVCVTRGILNILSKDELKAVLGHEISHIKNRDMAIITLLSVVPMVLYWVSWSLMWGRGMGGRRQREGYSVLIGLGALAAYFVTNLLVLYASRIREYSADKGSVRTGNPPQYLASALYKLVYSTAVVRNNPAARGELQRMEGMKAFFVNDISNATKEIKELVDLDRDHSGTIDAKELMALRSQTVNLTGSEKMMEIFTTHPNTLKRIKHLSELY